MSHKRLAHPVLMLVAATGSAALMTGGIAEAAGWGQSAPQAHSRQVASAPAGKSAHGGCAARKKAPSGARPVSVNGHTVRVLFPRHRSAKAATKKRKSPSAGMRVASGNGHTVRAVRTGLRATRPC